jgi:SNF2 family DNA or RNA helicase
MIPKIYFKHFNDYYFYVDVKDGGYRFNEIKNIIKNLPVREFNNDIKRYLVPVRDLSYLIKQLKINNLDEFLVADKTVKENALKFVNWKANQLEIKKHINSCDAYPEFVKFCNDNLYHKTLESHMLPFQMLGSYFMINGINSVIGDMVGLGKTVQALAASEYQFMEKRINFCIIICPATLKKKWEKEINSWLIHGRPYFISDGDKKKREKQYKKAYKFDYMIINYDKLLWDMDLIYENIIQKGFKYCVIMDEIQYIKNWDAQRSEQTKMITDYAVSSLGVTATALENSIKDLWSIFHALDYDVLGSVKLHSHFEQMFLIYDWWRTKVIGYKNSDIIKQRIAPYFFRRLKDEVIEQLPELMESNFWIDLSKKQREIYDDLGNQIIDKIEDNEKKMKIANATILSMITHLRMCVLDAKTVGYSEHLSTKLEFLLNFIKENDDIKKIVIFVHFVDVVEYLREVFESNGYKGTYIHGSEYKEWFDEEGNKKRIRYKSFVKQEKRVASVDKFDADPEQKIIVLSDSLAEGIDIFSANYLVNFDLLFNPAKITQRIGRFDRIGSKMKKLTIINLICNNTIEEDMYENKIKVKRKMFKDIIDDGKVEKRYKFDEVKFRDEEQEGIILDDDKISLQDYKKMILRTIKRKKNK